MTSGVESELVERLTELANQKTSDEQTLEEYRAADFECAWNTIVQKVRGILTTLRRDR